MKISQIIAVNGSDDIKNDYIFRIHHMDCYGCDLSISVRR